MGNNSVEDYITYQIAHHIFLVVSPTLMILGCIGNTISFLVYFPKSKSQSDRSSSFYLAFLGLADSVSLFASALPGFLRHAANVDVIYQSGCGWYLFMLYSVTDVSIYAIVCLTIDRALSVFFPYRVKQLCSRKRAICTMAVTSCVLFCINIHLIFTTLPSDVAAIKNDNVTVTQRQICVDNTEFLFWKRYVWPWVDMTVLSFFPFITLLVLNSSIVFEMKRYVRKVHAEGHVSAYRVHHQKRLNVLVALICGVFFFTTAPITTLHILEPYWDRDEPEQEALHAFVQAILGHVGYLTNCVNFILYYYRSTNFKQDLKRLLKNMTIVPTNTLQNSN